MFPAKKSKRVSPAALGLALAGFCFVPFTVGASAAPAANKAPKPASPQVKVAALVAAYEKEIKATAGVSAVRVADGGVLASIRSDRRFVPASNQKLLTGAFALARLGGEFKFVTTVYLLKSGVILIRGDFDPTLGDGRLAAAAGKSRYGELDRWAEAVKAASPKKPPPRILLEDSPKAADYRHPDWPQSQHRGWYAAPVGRLNFNNNCFDVRFHLAKGRAIAGLFPDSRFWRIVNKVKPGRKNAWWLTPDADHSVITLRGTINQSRPGALTVAADNPPMLLGRTLAERLVLAGVKFTGQLRVVEPGKTDLRGAKAICRTTTPLARAMGLSNRHSLNMAAECMFLRAGDGTWSGSAKKMAAVLVRDYGLKASELKVRDGGGLSRGNLVAPAAMTKVLLGVLRRRDATLLLHSMAVSGGDGSLIKRLGGPYRGRVLGKTGWIRKASGLSGYVLDKAGRPKITYSVLVGHVPGGTNWRAKKLQDDVCRVLVDYLDAPPDKPRKPRS